MKNSAIFLVLCATGLWAADFWQSKAFTEWNDKDVKKMLDSSPWSKETSVAIGAAAEPDAGSKRSRSRPGNMGEASGNDNLPGAMEDSGKGGGRGGNGGSPDGMTIQTATLIVRWQSARPVKEALARMKYGSEAGASKEAKTMLDTVEPNYIIVVSGVMKNLLAGAQKQDILAASELLVKGKDPIKPVDFMAQPNGRGMDAYFAFPKSADFSVDDKEVEFSAKFHAITVRQRFQFKSMMVNGKLEL